MFPEGGPGVALLLLRISVAAIFLMSASNTRLGSSTHLMFGLVLLISIALTVGCLTPVWCVIACLSAIANLLLGPNPYNPTFIVAILDTVALAFLGPGAYSIDARLFGRRVIVVPPRKHTGEE